MNRDEILTKSRAENVMEDERGRLTKLESARFSHCVFLILYCLLKLFVPLDDIGDYALSLLFFGSVFSQFVYYAVKQKFGSVSAMCAFFALAALFARLAALGRPWPRAATQRKHRPTSRCLRFLFLWKRQKHAPQKPRLSPIRITW